MKNILPIVVVSVLVLGAYILGSVNVTKVEEPKLSAQSGPDVYTYLNVHDWFQHSGGINSIDPVDDAYTLTALDMLEYNVITFDASTTQAALTVTLPASTTFPIAEEAGATRTWIIENPFTAAATTTTIAAGTGIDLQEPDGQNVVIGINNYAYLTCTYGLNSGAPRDYVCLVDEAIPAD